MHWSNQKNINKGIALLDADLELITQWHQKYQSDYHKARNLGDSLFFALSDMAGSLAEKMRRDGVSESDIEAMSSHWDNRQYHILGL